MVMYSPISKEVSQRAQEGLEAEGCGATLEVGRIIPLTA